MPLAAGHSMQVQTEAHSMLQHPCWFSWIVYGHFESSLLLVQGTLAVCFNIYVDCRGLCMGIFKPLAPHLVQGTLAVFFSIHTDFHGSCMCISKAHCSWCKALEHIPVDKPMSMTLHIVSCMQPSSSIQQNFLPPSDSPPHPATVVHRTDVGCTSTRKEQNCAA